MIMNELNADPTFYLSFAMVAFAIIAFIGFVMARKFKE